MGTTKDENKNLTDFSLRLSASARDMFFLPQRRRDAEGFLYFHIKPLEKTYPLHKPFPFIGVFPELAIQAQGGIMDHLVFQFFIPEVHPAAHEVVGCFQVIR